MSLHPLAGKPAPYELLVNVPRLISAYYTRQPDPADPAQRVAFGTSGHRGTSFRGSFNEDHILAISQAICEYRQAQGITGPLFIGMDTHALSEPALASAIEVFAGNEQEIMIHAGAGYTPTPVISHAILTYNRGRTTGLADGVVITPSHNPPTDGGFKYNPPDRRAGRHRHHQGDAGARQRNPEERAARGQAHVPGPRDEGRDHAPVRLHHALRVATCATSSTCPPCKLPGSRSASIRWAAPALASGSRSPRSTG